MMGKEKSPFHHLFYYNQLSEAEQTLYWRVNRDLGQHRRISIFPQNTDAKRLLTAARYVTLDYPEYYWSKGDFTVTSTDILEIQWDDLCPAEFTVQTDKEIFHEIELLNLNRFSWIRDKVMAIQEWILSKVNYDYGEGSYQMKTAQTIFPLFTEGRGICLGIAKTAKMILDLYGEESIIILGKLFQDEKYEHAWNLIKDGEHFLHTDFTMGYPIFEQMWNSCYQGEKKSWLLIPGNEITLSHQPLPEIYYPEESIGGIWI